MLSLPLVDFDTGKNEVIDFCRKGVMPFTFHEKMRMLLGSKRGNGSGSSNVCFTTGVDVPTPILRRFAGGGLMSRLMLA